MKTVFWMVLAVLLTGGSASAAAVGPSFPCTPPPIDALSRLTCSNDNLARSEIWMVQTYYALRQLVGPEGQKPIKSEFLSFVVNTRRVCGLPPVEPARDQSQLPLPANAANCVTASYNGQRTAWANRLSGPAAEEAARTPEQNIAVQGETAVPRSDSQGCHHRWRLRNRHPDGLVGVAAGQKSAGDGFRSVIRTPPSCSRPLRLNRQIHWPSGVQSPWLRLTTTVTRLRSHTTTFRWR